MTFSGSYPAEDVRILMTPRSIGMIDVDTKETLIQSGRRHYSEMLSPETIPDARYMDLYEAALARNAGRLAGHVIELADSIAEATANRPTIVSLARAGTPIGVLLRRRLAAMGVDVAHYSVSIIRDRGIDRNALKTIIDERGRDGIVFVDGWTGKGAIAGELATALVGTGVAPILAVIADPAGRADMAATSDDYVIPSGILNGIVSGLISRSVLNDELVGEGDYHACLFQHEYAAHDRSNDFVRAIEAAVPERSAAAWTPAGREATRSSAEMTVAMLMDMHGVQDVNRVKPGIAEATRAILRRVPHAVHLRDRDDDEVAHIVHLAHAARIPIHTLPADSPYGAATIIRTLGE